MCKFKIYSILFIQSLLNFTDFIFPQVYNISGRISTDKKPVAYASIIFINTNDTTQKYTTITDTSGNYKLSILTDVERNNLNKPAKFELAQNYPNPFSNSTAILYKLNEQADIKLIIYDILGQEVRRFDLGEKYAGIHQIIWDGKNNFDQQVTPGIYLYQILNGKEKLTRKMVYGMGSNNFQLQIPITNFSTNNNLLKESNITSEELVFTIKIKNTAATEPQIRDSVLTGILIRRDTVLNFVLNEVETGRTFNIKGNVSTISSSVKYTEVEFIKVNDTINKFSVITDSLGNYQLSIITSSDKLMCNIEIKNTSTTIPKIHNQIFENIIIQNDTTLNFIVEEVETSQMFNIQGNVATTSSPVRYAEIIFINADDTTSKFSAITDSSGNYRLSIVTSSGESIFKTEVTNTDSTRPQIYSRVFDNIIIQNDTTINFILESVGSWRKVKSGITSGLRDIDFPDSKNGWVVGENGVILHSSDSGESWQQQKCPIEEILWAVDFVDSSNGWICSQNHILKTTNGGKNWDIKFSDSLWFGLYGDIQFLNAEIGFVVCVRGPSLMGAVFRTTDGGETWQNITPHSLPAVTHISIVDEHNIWICGFGRLTLRSTSDLGLTWTQNLNIPGGYFFSEIQFVDKNNGLICDGGLLRTTDGGKIWIRQILPSSYPKIGAFFFIDSLNGWLAPRVGTETNGILQTTDGCQTWEFFPIESKLNASSIYFINKDLGWAVGTEGLNTKPEGVILLFNRQ